MAAPVLNKVSAFLCQPAVRLDFRMILDQGQVLIVDLGGLSGETQQLYGSLLVTGLEQAAMARRDRLPAQRRPFFCAIDEFPFFCARDAATLARILSEVRKFNVLLGLAHQTLAQTDRRLQGALENARRQCIFATGRQSAQVLAEALYQPDPAAVKHVVDDPAGQARSHSLFESLGNQLEMAVQQIMGLRWRHLLVKLPDLPGLVAVRAPAVPPVRLTQDQLGQIKRALARQTGAAWTAVQAQIAARGRQLEPGTAPALAQKDPAWTARFFEAGVGGG